MLKSEIRNLYLQKRKALSSDEVFLLSENIFKNFINHFKPVEGQKIHLFIPIEKFNEIRTYLFIQYFLKEKIRVFLPKIIGSQIIAVEIFTGTLFESNKWGISEPISNRNSEIIDFDFIITPLLYCDRKGNRVGYGKGFYDAFFEKVSTESKKVGLNYFNAEYDVDDISDFDIPLDYLVTPTEILSF